MKPGGRLGLAQGCFRDEPDELPDLFRTNDGWHADYGRYHSPAWWRRHVRTAAPLADVHCEELPDGAILWEDDVLNRGDRARWSDDFVARSEWLVRQIRHGHTGTPVLTHLICSAVRDAPRCSGEST